MGIINWFKKKDKIVKPKFILHKYNSELFIECCNLLIDNGFKQIGDYSFERPCKNYGRRIFCVYHIYLDLIVNIYYPQEPMRGVASKEEMQKLIDRFNDEKIDGITEQIAPHVHKAHEAYTKLKKLSETIQDKDIHVDLSQFTFNTKPKQNMPKGLSFSEQIKWRHKNL